MVSTSARRWCSGWLIVSCFAIWIGWTSPTAQGADPQSADLPLKKVVLFSSGVGFFEHSGEVDGDRTIEFKFNAASINDLLKSMVARDLGGGHIAAVTYGSREPLAKTLRTFSIDLTRNPTLADLLRQVRGEQVRVSVSHGNENVRVDGLIVSVERRRLPAGKDEAIDIDVLNLKTDTGLHSIPLTPDIDIRLMNESLDKEFQDALTLLATAHTTDKKTVSLSFTGQGRRPVRVGYIQDSPIWKTSYRLVLDDKEAPFLQGWAIVENTTEHDWKDISMTLVSGRPVSFIMDLYEPLYVDRPIVVPELFGSLTPRTHGQDMSDREAIQGAAQRGEAKGSMLPVMTPSREPFVTSVVPVTGGGMGGFGGGFMGGAGSANNVANKNQPPASDANGPNGSSLDLKKGVAAAARADEVGELFRYSINRPVTLARQQSAMLPIVNESVKGEKVSIYNPDIDARHPMAGLKLHNTTPLHLMQGPITVFDGGEYAGDSEIEDIAPGASRLISYALDLNVEVAPRASSKPEELTAVKIVQGVLHWVRKSSRTQHYIVKNSGDRTKRVLIEQPIDATWELVSPKTPAEKTRDLYRFSIDAPATKSVELVVEEEHTNRDAVAISGMSSPQFAFYSTSQASSPAFKAAIAELEKRKAALGAVNEQIRQLDSEISGINTEQSRIRQNMAQLDKTSALYNRYVKMFGEQEDQIGKTRIQLKDLSAEAASQDKALGEFIRQMNVE